MSHSFILYAAIAVSLLWLAPRGWRRLQLSRAKHRSLAGHSRMASRVARWLPNYSFDGADFYAADGASGSVASQRRAGLQRLAEEFAQRFSRTRELSALAEPMISDLQFTSAYRVPFQFRQQLSKQLSSGSFVQSSDGVMLTDLDGNQAFDLTGSYGANLLGYDYYKGCIARANARVEALGPVLGIFHPLVADNARRLLQLSGLDEVSFHMSGTEAVMQAVRLARYHTRRSHLLRFCGAYHGWWGDVQPGVGNPLPADYTYTLKDMHADTLKVLRGRSNIACVLVNPLQALHPNASAAGDSSLLSGRRGGAVDKQAYSHWLQQLRQVCTERGIVLIFDEVFVGFRLAMGGAQEYFGVRADMVTYGKTLGGGYPIGALCGRRELMQRFRPQRPADICFARGTFNSHPYVMAAMNEFLQGLEHPAVRELYEGLDARWNARALALNQRLTELDLPLQVANLSSIFTVLYTQPSRYHWMLQFYFRAQGLALSWVGSGRLIFSLNYTDADFQAVVDRIIAAAQRMQADGWWSAPEGLSYARIRLQLLRELVAAMLPRWARSPRRLQQSEESA